MASLELYYKAIFPVFLYSYRNTCGSLGELVITRKTHPTSSLSLIIARSFKAHINDKFTCICEKYNAKIHGIVEHIILFTLQEIIVEIIIAQSYLIIFTEPSKCFTCLSVFFFC